MKQNTIISILTGTVLLSLILLFAGCSCPSINSLTESEFPQEVPAGPPGSSEASWSKGYDSISYAATDADLVVIGVISSVSKMSEKTGYTRFELFPEVILKGKPEGTILVNQSGEFGQPETGLSDDPIFQIGERYLLFMTKGVTPSVYKYPGPTGRFKITTGQVYSMNHVLTNDAYQAAPGVDFNGVSLGNVVEEITMILASTRFQVTESITLLRGESGNLDLTLGTGDKESGHASLNITWFSVENSADPAAPPGFIKGGLRSGMPDGMQINIIPIEFDVSPRSDYTAVIRITTDESTISPGKYWFLLDCKIGDSITENRMIKVLIETRGLSEITTGAF